LIGPDTIQAILDAARIDEVIGDFVTLKKRGVNMLGHCPFHNEKTPSFTVSPAKGIYKCFGCGKAGNSVNFVMEHEHYSYPEALKYLARKYNIEIEEKAISPEQQQALTERETLLNITEFASKHFVHNLHEVEEGKAIGLTYFRERGFTPEIIRKFELGYCLEKWDDFTTLAIKSGYGPESLVRSGLLIEKDKDQYYDRFRARVMFPIHNLSGKVTGFTGRILSSDKSKPKYVNSPESEIYNKSKTLYGIFFAKNSITSSDLCYLVEGNTDVISFVQAGIENVVASSGTSLTTEQIKMIRRYTPNITIIYDGDAAGIKASLRGTDMILQEGMNVKIVMLPAGEDPDSYARSHSREEINNYIRSNEVNFIFFKSNLLLKEAGGDPVKKAGLVKEIVQTISIIPDAVSREFYVRECSGRLDVGEQVLWNELNKVLRARLKKTAGQNEEEEAPEPTTFDAEPQTLFNPFDSEAHEKHLVFLLLNYGEMEMEFSNEDEKGHKEYHTLTVSGLMQDIAQALTIEFTNTLYNQVFDDYMKLVFDKTPPNQQYFINHEDAAISKLSIDLLSNPHQLSPNWEAKNNTHVPVHGDDDRKVLTRDVMSTLHAIKSRQLEKMMKQLQDKIKIAHENRDEDECQILQAKHIEYYKQYREANSVLGRVIPR
jgi:DNA primase